MPIMWRLYLPPPPFLQPPNLLAKLANTSLFLATTRHINP